MSGISSNTLAAGDVQHIVTEVMQSQQKNGHVYLKSTALPPTATSQLAASGNSYCVAAQVKPISQVGVNIFMSTLVYAFMFG